jgi:hypothetical protein
MDAETKSDWGLWERHHARRLAGLTLAVVGLGLVWRTVRYLMAMPVWGDEGMLLVNYQTRTYSDIFGPIDHCQVAPLLFHWAEIAAIQLLGPSEWSLRLPPYLGAVAGLLLFWGLARRTLSPLPRFLAASMLAVAIWPASMAGLCKPYAWDLLASVSLLTLFAARVRRPMATWPLWALAALAPAWTWASYPAAFVAGGVSLGLLRSVWQDRRARAVAPYLLFNLLVGAAFVAHYWFVSRLHLSSDMPSGETTAGGMTRMWGDQFPPTNPLKFVVWFLSTAAGEIAAYPLGSQRGGSIATTLLSLIGARHLWRTGRHDWVVAFAGALSLGFVAAALHKYPMGSCRLNQQAAPIFCLLGGVGGAAVLRRVSPAKAHRTVALVATVYLLIGVGGLTRDLMRPARNEEANWSRESAVELRDRVAGRPVMRVGTSVVPTQQWYLWSYGLWANTEYRGESETWVVVCGVFDPGEEERLRQRLPGGGWEVADRWRARLEVGPQRTEAHETRAYLFRREPQEWASR